MIYFRKIVYKYIMLPDILLIRVRVDDYIKTHRPDGIVFFADDVDLL